VDRNRSLQDNTRGGALVRIVTNIRVATLYICSENDRSFISLCSRLTNLVTNCGFAPGRTITNLAVTPTPNVRL
jgi:hypothetical protein